MSEKKIVNHGILKRKSISHISIFVKELFETSKLCW